MDVLVTTRLWRWSRRWRGARHGPQAHNVGVSARSRDVVPAYPIIVDGVWLKTGDVPTGHVAHVQVLITIHEAVGLKRTVRGDI